jgi:hypothetical protein
VGVALIEQPIPRNRRTQHGLRRFLVWGLLLSTLVGGSPAPTVTAEAAQRPLEVSTTPLVLASGLYNYQFTAIHAPKPKPKPVAKPVPRATPVSRSDVRVSIGSPKDYAASQVGAGEFSCLNLLWEKESGWSSTASNPSSGAYGIPQSLPGSKMASAGSDWATNPITQINWGLQYIRSRYGSPCGAWAHSQSVGWY